MKTNSIVQSAKSEISKLEQECKEFIEKKSNEIAKLKRVLSIFKENFTGKKLRKKKSGKQNYKTIKWGQRIPEFIQSRRRLVSSKEILDSMFKRKHKSTKRLLSVRLSVQLNAHINKREIISYEHKNGKCKNLYGTSDMFMNGNPIKEYLPKK